MLDFYKKALAISFSLLLISILIAVLCLNSVYYSDPLLPAHKSVIPWSLETITDKQKGGTSSISVHDSTLELDYDYVLTQDVQFPHVTVVFAFAQLQNAHQLLDLSRYSTATLRVKCDPENLLSLHLHSFDAAVTDTANFSTYRIAESLESCGNEWSRIEVDLHYMNVPAWWLHNYNLDVSDQEYWLDQVVAFSIGVSQQGPIDTPANIRISEFTLHGRDWRYLWAFIVFFGVVWLIWGVWLFRSWTSNLVAHARENLLKDRPLMAYQQLSIEPHRDKEKIAVLRFMATEYANPDMNLEYAIATLGMNRTRINELLKAELGLTFSAYLNKLRLAEAARLLSRQEANISEIAYSVGYNNVSWFNKLFKQEYGCTPRAFKNVYQGSNRD